MKTRCLFLILWAGVEGWSQLPQPIFGDVPASAAWYNEVNLLRVRMITSGCQANPQKFCAEYDTNGYTPYYLTRGQAAVLIIRSLFSGIHGNPEQFWSDSNPHFNDVSTYHPQFRYIQKMKELGITSGCTSNAYCPDREISYGEIAVFMYRARQKRLAEDESAQVQAPPPCSASPYWDVPTEHGFCPYIAEAKNALGTRAVAPECSYGFFCPDVSFDANQSWIAGVRVRRGPLAFYLVQGILDADYPQSLPNAQSSPPVVTALDPVTTPPLECYADQPLFMNFIAPVGTDLVGISDTLYITFGGSASYSFTVAPTFMENGIVRWKPAPLTVQGLGAHLISHTIPFDPAKSYEHPVHHAITSACLGSGASVATSSANPTKPYPTTLWANQNVLFRGVSQSLSLRGVTLGQSRDVQLEGYGPVGATVSNVSHAGLTASFLVPNNAPAGQKQISVLTRFKQEPNGTEADAESISYVTVAVADPTPVLTSLSRYSGTQGEDSIPVTLYGAYFGTNPRVCLNGVCSTDVQQFATSNGVTLTKLSCTNCTEANASISATLSIASNATLGAYSIAVVSQGASGNGWAPGPQGGSSGTGSQSFQVQQANPLTVDSLQVTQQATPNPVDGALPSVASASVSNTSTAFATVSSSDLITVLMNSGTVTVFGANVQPPSGAAQIRWAMDKDPTDTVDTTGTQPISMSTTTGATTSFAPTRPGNYRLVA